MCCIYVHVSCNLRLNGANVAGFSSFLNDIFAIETAQFVFISCSQWCLVMQWLLIYDGIRSQCRALCSQGIQISSELYFVET